MIVSFLVDLGPRVLPLFSYLDALAAYRRQPLNGIPGPRAGVDVFSWADKNLKDLLTNIFHHQCAYLCIT